MASLLIRSTLFLAFALASAKAQDLPKRSSPGDFVPNEPALMLNDAPYLLLSAENFADPVAALPSPAVAKLEAELDRAKKDAALRGRLCKAGVVSKLEAEQGEMKVVRLSKDLADARLETARRNVEERRKQAPANEAAETALARAETRLAAASATAQDANVKWEQARLAAAEIRVWRERKLMSLGAGSRSSLKRAEAALQSLTPHAARQTAGD
jgi:multidrug resistance efflux pump